MTPTTLAPRDTILIVDDSADTVAMLADLLEGAGFNALVALRGERAISIARQVTPDLVLMDAVMPGLDGFETCRQMKRDEGLARLPVIFMTGLAETDHIVRALAVGGSDYVGKPVNATALLARIRMHLANARVEQGARTALDATGRFLFAVDEAGRLNWWTPQAGRLIGPTLAEGLAAGSQLPEPLPTLLAQTSDPTSIAVVLRGPDPQTSIQIAGIGRLGQGEILLRVRRDAAAEGADIPTRLSERLQISPREADVLSWIAQGKSNRDIADILDLSPRTVNKHLERIFKKMGVENRTSAAAIALKLLEK